MGAPLRITPHHTTSHHITPHHITSHHITSHHITSHHITSHHITSHHTRQTRVSKALRSMPFLLRNSLFSATMCVSPRAKRTAVLELVSCHMCDSTVSFSADVTTWVVACTSPVHAQLAPGTAGRPWQFQRHHSSHRPQWRCAETACSS